MAITGTESRFQNMKVLAEELEVAGTAIALGAAAVTSLTDNSGGTANDTLEDVATAVTGVDGTGSNAASKADVDARLASIANDFADLAAKVNTILARLRTAGIIAT